MDENLRLLSDVMEKMIDSQIANTQALTSLKASIDVTTDRLKAMEGFFSNGFRSDIKRLLQDVKISQDNISESKAKIVQVLEQGVLLQGQQKDLQVGVDSYKKFGFWFKVVAGFIVAIATIIAAAVKFTN